VVERFKKKKKTNGFVVDQKKVKRISRRKKRVDGWLYRQGSDSGGGSEGESNPINFVNVIRLGQTISPVACEASRTSDQRGGWVPPIRNVSKNGIERGREGEKNSPSMM
jgi:hypothetical protein